ncbi:MAG: flagellar protein FliS [Gemmatimonadetes bacterium]|nr:flagellar protein FliS [Gemmatimonadota bacterium]
MQNNGEARYKTSAIENGSPADLVLRLYDHILERCEAKDFMGAKKAVVELQGSLDLEYLDVSGPLYRLYEYVADRLRKQDYEEAERIIQDLRSSWLTAMETVGAGA